MSTDKVRWRPGPEHLERSRVARLMRKVGAASWQELHAWSVADVGRFWDTVLEDLSCSWFVPYDRTLDMTGGFPWAKWFVGGRTNLVLNCLDRHARGDLANAEALVAEGEDGRVATWTYHRLRADVGRAAGCLRSLGVKPGDRVGIYMPMIGEVVVALFACFAVGAVAVPVFSAFGADALAVRLKDAEAVVLFTTDGGLRRGKVVDVKTAADQALAQAPTVRHAIVKRHTLQPVPWTRSKSGTPT